MREKDYIVTIGSTSIDAAGYSHHPLNYADSNPGKIKLTSGSVERNITHNLALLGENAWPLSAVGGGFYGQSLPAQTSQSGVYIDECLIVPGENTSNYLSLPNNTGEMLVVISDMSISDYVSAESLAQRQESIRDVKIIVANCNLNEEALVWTLEDSGETPVSTDPVSTWKYVKIHDHLGKTHTLKPNHLEAETLSGIALSRHEDVTKVVAWFHQHGLNHPTLSMGEDGVYCSDINDESGWPAPIKTNAINIIGVGDATMAGLTSCWIDGMPLIGSVRFTWGCSSIALACEYINNPELSVINATLLVENTECLN